MSKSRNLYQISSLFQKYDKCTFCGSKKNKIRLRQRFVDNFYLEAIRSDLNIPLKLLKKIKIYKCQNCGVVQNNPWFKKEISRKIYSNIYGQHNRSWTNLINFFKKGYFPNHGDLFEILTQKLNIKNYAEFNSPFMGMFINFFSKEYRSNRIEKKRIFDYCIKYLSSRQVAAMTVVQQKKSKEVSKKFCNQIKELKAKNYVSKRIKKYLFIDHSNLSWGQNDNYKSVNSKSLASELFDIEIIDLNFENHKKFSFDLFGIFHTLDHTFYPKKVLNFALKTSSYVVVYCHVDEKIGQQHLFSLTDSFLKYLKRNNIYSINLTNKINKHFKSKELYFICSTNKKNLEKLDIK